MADTVLYFDLPPRVFNIIICLSIIKRNKVSKNELMPNIPSDTLLILILLQLFQTIRLAILNHIKITKLYLCCFTRLEINQLKNNKLLLFCKHVKIQIKIYSKNPCYRSDKAERHLLISCS